MTEYGDEQNDTDDRASGEKQSFLAKLGPGLITGAADDDPSGISTYSTAGAAYGFGLLWTALFSLPLMIAVQLMCAPSEWCRVGAWRTFCADIIRASCSGSLAGWFSSPTPSISPPIWAMIREKIQRQIAQLSGQTESSFIKHPAQKLRGFHRGFSRQAF